MESFVETRAAILGGYEGLACYRPGIRSYRRGWREGVAFIVVVKNDMIFQIPVYCHSRNRILTLPAAI
jgi:hypothetical protein